MTEYINQDVLEIAITTLTVILSIVVAVGAIVFGGVILKWGQKERARLDAALVPFGQSATGRYLHEQLGVIGGYVDDADDALIVESVTAINRLAKRKIITVERASELASEVIKEARLLLDGQADQTEPVNR